MKQDMVQGATKDAAAPIGHPGSVERESRFAASTLVATTWLICFAPERLKGWLERHGYGAELERDTRASMAKNVTRRAKVAAQPPPDHQPDAAADYAGHSPQQP